MQPGLKAGGIHDTIARDVQKTKMQEGASSPQGLGLPVQGQWNLGGGFGIDLWARVCFGAGTKAAR